jgi:hypothetical protein
MPPKGWKKTRRRCVRVERDAGIPLPQKLKTPVATGASNRVSLFTGDDAEKMIMHNLRLSTEVVRMFQTHGVIAVPKIQDANDDLARDFDFIDPFQRDPDTGRITAWDDKLMKSYLDWNMDVCRRALPTDERGAIETRYAEMNMEDLKRELFSELPPCLRGVNFHDLHRLKAYMAYGTDISTVDIDTPAEKKSSKRSGSTSLN